MTSGPRDRAAVVAAAIVQVLERALLASRDELEAILRDEFADAEREAVTKIRESE